MLKDLQDYAAEIRAAADAGDFAQDDERRATRISVFCSGDFSTEESAMKYFYSVIESGRQKLNKWKTVTMKRHARDIIEAASDGIALIMKK